jgi:2-(1,2-epoxy-1,2-dihydrophenyl)acetyl-CoA isomerase
VADRDRITLTEDRGVATVLLNAPEQLNALTPGDFADLRDALTEVRGSHSARVLVVKGAGRAFCAGGDFKGSDGVVPLADGGGYGFIQAYETAIKPVVDGLLALPIPTIAMIGGPAYGSGLDLALACDIRIASTDAAFCVAWLRRALVPAAGTTWMLPRLIGLGRAAEIILTARQVGAEEAERIGLVTSVVAPDELEGHTYETAASLGRGAPIALALTKKSLYAGTALTFEAALQALAAYQTITFGSSDFREATDAFLERREPQFSGT